jgi:hypothetical protein
MLKLAFVFGLIILLISHRWNLGMAGASGAADVLSTQVTTRPSDHLTIRPTGRFP